MLHDGNVTKATMQNPVPPATLHLHPQWQNAMVVTSVIANRKGENKGNEDWSRGQGGRTQTPAGSREGMFGDLSPCRENQRPGDIMRILFTLLFLSAEDHENPFTEISEVLLVPEYYYSCFIGGLTPKGIQWMSDGATHINHKSCFSKPSRTWVVVKSF